MRTRTPTVGSRGSDCSRTFASRGRSDVGSRSSIGVRTPAFLRLAAFRTWLQDVVKWIQAEFPGTEAEDYVILEENVRFSLPEVLAGV